MSFCECDVLIEVTGVAIIILFDDDDSVVKSFYIIRQWFAPYLHSIINLKVTVTTLFNRINKQRVTL